MNKKQILETCLNKEKKVIENALKQAKDTRNSAPSFMESASDTTRARSEALIAALEEKLTKIENLVQSIPKIIKSKPNNMIVTGSYLELISNGKKMRIIIVPEGVGGKTAGDIQLISSLSPLGKVLYNKKRGEKVQFNNQLIKIVKIE